MLFIVIMLPIVNHIGKAKMNNIVNTHVLAQNPSSSPIIIIALKDINNK